MGQCSNHPDAPHGYDRNASHNAGCYVCECESWEPPDHLVYGPDGQCRLRVGLDKVTWYDSEGNVTMEIDNHPAKPMEKKMGYAPKLYDRTLTYTQEKDTWDPALDEQLLELKTHRVDDGPNGSYITISTERWALDREDIDAFCAQLKKALEGL